jgi:beta-glucosidase
MRRGFSVITLFSLPIVLFLSGVAALAQTASQSVRNQGPQPITPEMEHQVDAMVRKLTLEQKIALIGGEDGMFIRSEPSIGLPRLKMSDGPMGVRTWGPSTAYAAGIGLAASWDTSLAEKVGAMIGADARARGVNFVLAPGVNIYRAPMNGRNFEYFGEDPYLAGKFAVGYINGVQSRGVSATVKHFALNNAEYDRHNQNSVADERTLREIYLPAFEAAVKEGHVGAVMDSYNLVNGEHSTQSQFLNIQVLREDWGFRGIVMSDWGATYDGVAAANNGLDLEMPSAQFMTVATLLPAIKDGRVSEAVIDEKVRRILRTAVQFGFLERDQAELNIPLYHPQGSAVALESAEEGAVLLKNEGNLLPLDRKAIHSIAVLGPDAYPAVPGGGGSSHVDAFAPVSFMTGLSNALDPGTKVYWNAGIPSPEEIFKSSRWCTDPECRHSGLFRAEYVLSADERLFSTVDETVNHTAASWMSEQTTTPRRMEWLGYFLPKISGSYRVVAQGGGSDRYELWIDGTQVLKEVHNNGAAARSATVSLGAGKPARVHFIYFPGQQGNTASLGIVAEDKLVDPEAIRLAKMADVVVLAVGFSPATESEGFDRTYELPFGQEALIQAVAAANPHTIVVLTSGGSVATRDWIDKVPVLLQTWYAGQQAGNALLKLLDGDVNPSGKLPISWEKKIEDNPTDNNYYEPAGTRDVKYSEGIFMGYRYYETSQVKPLFPFGFGLSYTSFAFSNLSVSPESVSPDGPITVSFDVKNTGSRAGAEIAQIYVGDPSATVQRPQMELKGFSRVALAPGEVHRVTVTLNKRSLAYWDVQTHAWKVDPGNFIVYVGDSSANVPLQESFTVQ